MAWPQALHPHQPPALPTWGTARDVVRLLLLLVSPIAAAVLGIPALRLHALSPAGAHAALLKLLVVFYLKGPKALGKGPTENQPSLPPIATQDPGMGETPRGLWAEKARFSQERTSCVPLDKPRDPAGPPLPPL